MSTIFVLQSKNEVNFNAYPQLPWGIGAKKNWKE